MLNVSLLTWGIHLNLASSRLSGSRREKQTKYAPLRKIKWEPCFHDAALTVLDGGIGLLSSKFRCSEVSQSCKCTSLESTWKLISRGRWSLSIWSQQVQNKATLPIVYGATDSSDTISTWTWTSSLSNRVGMQFMGKEFVETVRRRLVFPTNDNESLTFIRPFVLSYPRRSYP